jgi:hypothetical protein
MDDKCLTDEEVTAYVDGVVDATLRQRIEAHLSRCPVCLHTVAELKELVSPDAARTPVPESVLSRAEGIITAHSHGSVKLDIVAVLKGGICRILDTTGELLTPRRPLVAPVRSGRRRPSSPRIAKSLSGYLVTIELNASHDDVKPVLTLNEEATSAKPDGIRTRLYSSGACETKYTHNGKVTFSSLARGLFRIEIEDVGAVDLEIK